MAFHELLAGWASEDITPAPGIHMGGYWGRKSGATGVRDELKAKALVFAQKDQKVALVALDLVGLSAATVGLIRSRIQERYSLPGEAVMVCCSHTHSGPLTVPFRGMGEVDTDYLGRVQEVVVGLVGQAAGSCKAVRLAYRKVPVALGINRRQSRPQGKTVIGQNPAGPVAPYAHAVRLDAGDGEGAVLFSHACHPVVFGSANHRISADFAGAASRYIEAQVQRTALFVNGACGDINPQVRGDSGAEVEEAGRELGQAVVEGLEEAEEVDPAGIGARSVRVLLPLLEPPPALRMEVEKWVLQLKAEVKEIAGRGGDSWAQMVPRARLEWAQDMLERARTGTGDRYQPFEIQGLRIGHLGLLGLEGEIFVRYQLDLEASSPLQPAMVCGYANGCIGYVPAAEDYLRRGYEVEEAYKVYPSVQMIAPESEGVIRQQAAAVLADLAR